MIRFLNHLFKLTLADNQGNDADARILAHNGPATEPTTLNKIYEKKYTQILFESSKKTVKNE